MDSRAKWLGALFVALVVLAVLLGYFLSRKGEDTQTGAPITQTATKATKGGAAVAAEAAAKDAADAAEAKGAKGAEAAEAKGAEAAEAEGAERAERAEAEGAEAARRQRELEEAARAEAAKAEGAERAEAQKAEGAEAAGAEAQKAEAARAEGQASAARRITVEISEGPATPQPEPVVSETTLPSWPFEVGAAGASCAKTCEGKGLVCDEETQGSATYGREIAFEALRRAGVAQHGRSEDEWQGSFRVRDKYTSSGDQVLSMPGLWMHESEAAPNWKSERHTSVPSTCAASHGGLRRVCACKPPPPKPAETQAPPPAPPPPPPPPETQAPALPRSAVIDLDPTALSGESIPNAGSAGGVATLVGKAEPVTILERPAIHLVGAARSSIVLPLADVHTISIWFYITSVGPPTVWLTQAISGGEDSSGILTWGFGAIWTGPCYHNGGAAKSTNPNVLTPFVSKSSTWQHMTFVARGVQRASVFRLFASSGGTEAMDVNVGRIRVFNYAVSEAENRALFLAGQ